MDQFVLAIVNGAKASTGSSSDAALLNNKAQVGIAMADAGINDLAFAAQVIATVTADPSTVGIVESVITMAAADTAGLANATATLESFQAILADVDSAATLTTTLANLKTVMQNLAEDVTAGTVTNIAATLTAATATVEAATQDASFVANPETLATSIAANPTAVEEDAAAVVEEATTPTTPSTGGGGGGSSTPAATTQTVAVSADGSSDASSLASTYNFTAGTYAYTIAGFNDGDILDLPTGITPTIINTSFSDTNLTVQWAYDGDVITINLTGIPSADDGNIYGVTSFNTAFGAGSIA
jgi:hypothetical protein